MLVKKMNVGRAACRAEREGNVYFRVKTSQTTRSRKALSTGSCAARGFRAGLLHIRDPRRTPPRGGMHERHDGVPAGQNANTSSSHVQNPSLHFSPNLQ